MDENTTSNETVSETPVEANVATTPRKPRAPKPAVKKTLEELHTTAIAKLTDTEKNDLIKSYREELNLLQGQVNLLDNNAKSAYEKARAIEQTFAEYKLKATAKLNFARQAVDHCRTAIILAATPE